MKQNCCANCAFWAGDSSSYAAPCTNLDVAISRPYFDHMCAEHKPRVETPMLQSMTRGNTIALGTAGSAHNPPCPKCGSNAYVRRVGDEWFCGADAYYWR